MYVIINILLLQGLAWLGRDPLLKKVSEVHNGRYTCVSDDPAKVVFGSVDVTVLGKLIRLIRYTCVSDDPAKVVFGSVDVTVLGRFICCC